MAHAYEIAVTDNNGTDKDSVAENDLLDILASFGVIEYHDYSFAPNRAQFFPIRMRLRRGEKVRFSFDYDGISHSVSVAMKGV